MRRSKVLAATGVFLLVLAGGLIVVAGRSWQNQTASQAEVKPVNIPTVANSSDLDQIQTTLDDEGLDISVADEAALDAELTEDF